jgi:hypothetical protein
MKRWSKLLLLYPLLFAAYPTLALISVNINEVTLSVSVRPLLISMLAGLALMGLLAWLLRSWEKSALLTALLLVGFFSYGQVYTGLQTVTLLGEPLGRHRYLAPFFGALLLAGSAFILRARVSLAAWNRAAGIMGLVLVLLPLLSLTPYIVDEMLDSSAVSALGAEEQLQHASAADPDIYYIILDSYTRQDILMNAYQYDNSAFISALEEMGFYVAECSLSNYASTELSLSSSLNLDYLEQLAPEFERMETLSNDAHTSLPQLMRRSKVRAWLERIGYQTVAFETGFNWSSISSADYYYVPDDSSHPLAGMRQFEVLLANTTALSILSDARGMLPAWLVSGEAHPYYPEHVERELFKLKTLPEIPYIEGPKFVFAHIIVPHYPMVFMPDGELRTDPRYFQNAGQAVDQATFEEGYLGQIEFINNRMLEIIPQIIQRSQTPPVIIIQGDHGVGDLGILNAYYLPGSGADGLYPTISPVNSFRVVFNTYFGVDLPLLEDRSYYSSVHDRFNLTQFDDPNPACALP